MAQNGVKTIIEIKAKGERELKNLTKSILGQKAATKDLIDTTNMLLKSSALLDYVGTVQHLTNAMVKLSKRQTEYMEDLNLLDVAYGNTNNSGKKLVNTMSDIIGLDQQSLVKSLGVYKQMSSAMGIAGDASALLSEDLLKMQADISSLYNLDFARTGQILQVTMSSNTKSIRALGGDITETSLAQTALNLGIKKSVDEMNRAEKTILIYLTLEKQLANANGDLAKTINSVSNQTKIMQEQWNMLSRQLGSVFIPILQTILPYLNAILMTTNTIVSSILGLLGIDVEKWADEFGIASGYVDDFEDSLNGATGANEKLNKSLRSFDKLNVIRTPQKTTSGAGAGGLTGGVSEDILAKMKEYNLHLDNARNKSKQIADKMRELLGFHKELNEETGQWEWKYGGIGESLKNIYTNFKDLNPKAKIFVGFMTVLAGKILFNNIKNLIGLFGRTKLVKNMMDALTPTQLLVEQFGLLKKFDKFNFGNVATATNEWSNLLTTTQKLQTVLLGGVGIVAGFKLAQASAKNMAEEGVNATNILTTSLSGLAGVIGGGLAGAAVGGATGGIIGMVLGGITTIWAYMDETDRVLNTNMSTIEAHSKEIDAMYSNWQQSVERLNETYSTSTAEEDYYKKLWNELQSITDENGKIQDGYETRANFIVSTLSDALGIEINIVDGVVQKYDELKQSIEQIIEKKTAMIKLNAIEEEAQIAIKKITKAREDESNAYKDLTDAQDNFNKKLAKQAEMYNLNAEELVNFVQGNETGYELSQRLGIEYGRIADKLDSIKIAMRNQTKALKKQQDEYNKTKTTLDGYNTTISDWEYLTQLAAENNMEAINLYFDHERNLRNKSLTEQNTYWNDVTTTNTRYLEDLERNRSSYDDITYDNLKKSYQNQIDLASTKMEELKLLLATTNGKISTETIDEWGKMGETSVDKFIEYIQKLPSNVQTEVIDKMQEQGYKISDELQKGLNKIDVKVKVGADTTNIISDIGKALKSSFGGSNLFNLTLGGGSRASGGFVERGQIFQANEKGAEMIGTLDGKTAVANQNQIVTGIRQATREGMLDAFMSTGNQNVQVNIVAQGDTEGLLDFITFKQKQKDRQYDL